MTTYRIFFRDETNWICGRHDFEAETDATAVDIAHALFDACGDVCVYFDLWTGGRLIAGPADRRTDRLSAHAQEVVVRTEELIAQSNWRIARSRRLLERLGSGPR